MRTAIFGSGSLGTVLGAYIAKAGGQIDLIDQYAEHIKVLKKKGAHITGTVDFTMPVSALTPDKMSGKYDLIFLMTKQLDNKRVVKSLKPYLQKNGIICTLQNGLPELSVADVIGEDNVMGCAVAWGATLLGPGTAELTSQPEGLSFSLGRMNGVIDDKLNEVKRILELMCPVEVEKNFMGVRWSKLLINASCSGMSTVLGGTFGSVTQDKESRVCVQAIMKECMDVARAAGIRIEPVQGKDIVKLLDYNNWLKKKFSSFIIPIAIKPHAKLKASMLQDLEKGKKCEIDAINGVVCEYGRKYKVPTPYNDKVVEIVKGIENGKYKYETGNIALFADLKKKR